MTFSNALTSINEAGEWTVRLKSSEYWETVSSYFVTYRNSSVYVATFTCVSTVLPETIESVLLFFWTHSKVVIFSITSCPVSVGHVNTQTLTSVRCHPVKIVVA